MSSQIFVVRKANRVVIFEVAVLWLGSAGFSSPLYLIRLSLYIIIVLAEFERYGDSCLGFYGLLGMVRKQSSVSDPKLILN